MSCAIEFSVKPPIWTKGSYPGLVTDKHVVTPYGAIGILKAPNGIYWVHVMTNNRIALTTTHDTMVSAEMRVEKDYNSLVIKMVNECMDRIDMWTHSVILK